MDTSIPAEDTFELKLTKTIPTELQATNLQATNYKFNCKFRYKWNFSTNMGLAYLLTIGGTQVDFELHPMGIAGALDFMSDIPPTPVTIDGQEVIIYRVILDCSSDGTNRACAIMFGEKGSHIEASESFAAEKLTK